MPYTPKVFKTNRGGGFTGKLLKTLLPFFRKMENNKKKE